jgi:hypothetical protein
VADGLHPDHVPPVKVEDGVVGERRRFSIVTDYDFGAKVCPASRQRLPTFAGEPRRSLLTENRGSSRRQNRTRENLALAFASREAKKVAEHTEHI